MTKRKPPSLSSFSRQLPTEDELELVFKSLDTETDRGAALVGGELVNAALYTAISCRLARPEDSSQHSAWFSDVTAPLASFSSRIQMGRALGIYGPYTQKRLTAVRMIRNAFAHSLRPIDFGHELVIKECNHLALSRKAETPDSQHVSRLDYVMAVDRLTRELIKDAFDQGDREMIVSLP